MPFYPPKPNFSVINAGTTYSGGVLNFTDGQINLSGSVAVFDAPDLELTNGTISVYPNTLSITSNLAVSEQSANNSTLLYSTVFDLLSVVPSAAYSTRLLSSAYTGKCMNVRRSSDNTATDIGFVNGSLDVSTLLSFCGASNGFVTTWYNQGSLGSSSNASQSTAANQPKIVSNGSLITQNNLPSILFGNNIFLNYVGPSLTSNVTIFVVVQNSTYSALQQGFLGNVSGGYGGGYEVRYETNKIVSVLRLGQAGIIASTIEAPIQLNIITVTGTSSGTNLILNGNLYSNSTPIAATLQNSVIGVGYVPGNEYLNGCMSEFIQDNTSFSSSNTTIYDVNTASYFNIPGVNQ